eukprot:g37396.t1
MTWLVNGRDESSWYLGGRVRKWNGREEVGLEEEAGDDARLFEMGELNVESSGLEGAQAEDKVLFVKFVLRVAATLEEAEDRHVRGGLGRGVEMGSDWEVRLAFTGQEKMLSKTFTLSPFGLTDVEKTTSGA